MKHCTHSHISLYPDREGAFILYVEFLGRGAGQFLHTRWIRDGMECSQTICVCSVTANNISYCNLGPGQWWIVFVRNFTDFIGRLFQLRNVGLICFILVTYSLSFDFFTFSLTHFGFAEGTSELCLACN
jgi:hypothetical protein